MLKTTTNWKKYFPLTVLAIQIAFIFEICKAYLYATAI